ncbi:hypothetical protein [Staphylococcus gallinarum]|uniref:hypothetical protein n=1 Tax=Staphylococcus gallinarum TaxID=1293 RepID=UPI001E49B1BB|nr:hypothetical protein [Staphylococcus gallinarum]MCD8825436.1 hypothetical protein [Staphylococcus gallinarum]
MANEPIVFMKDDNDVNFYPLVHVEGIQGWPDNLSDLDIDSLKEELSGVNSQMVGIQSQIKNLQSVVENMPTVTGTDWQDITLNSGITEYSIEETPKARLVSVNGVSFLSLKGAVKGLKGSTTIGTLPANMINNIVDARPFVQNTSKTSGTTNFARWRIQTNGDIVLEGATQSTIESTHWFPIGTTVTL